MISIQKLSVDLVLTKSKKTSRVDEIDDSLASKAELSFS